MTHLRWTVAALMGLTVLSTGCGKKPEPAVPMPQASEPAARPNGDADREARERAEREAAEAARREAQRVLALLQEMVFFDYDMAEIRPDAKRTLDEKLPLLRNDPALRLRIEGHADERGSTEYNLALGARRAQTLANYLTSYGIEVSRIETMSWGEERPLARGTGEQAWSRNRRGEFVVTAGGPRISDADRPQGN